MFLLLSISGIDKQNIETYDNGKIKGDYCIYERI